MASRFCSSNYSRLVSVSYESPFFTKFFTTPYSVSVTCMHMNGYYFLKATCASRTSVVRQPRFGYPCYILYPLACPTRKKIDFMCTCLATVEVTFSCLLFFSQTHRLNNA